ncbi:MAG: tRNA pseudouridine(38-40) synthase TruA [Kofleriaceae bacterium]
MRFIRLVVEYDGTGLHGWQRQLNGPTVQQHLEQALAQLVQHEVVVRGASRTDAGVHARGQVCAFATERTIPLHGIRRGLNSMLPDQIAIRDATEVDAAFHPRHSATGKHYRYTILARPDRSPRWRDRAWHVSDRLDLDAMRAGAAHLVGEHDFAAFRAAGCAAKTTIRRLDAISIAGSIAAGAPAPELAELVHVDLHGNAFLRQMVRIIVGTLVEVGVGKRPPSQVAEIMASLDRVHAGITAPPQGLELVEVHYDGSRGARNPVSSGRDSR